MTASICEFSSLSLKYEWRVRDLIAVLHSQQASWTRGTVVRASDTRTEHDFGLGGEIEPNIGLIDPRMDRPVEPLLFRFYH